MIRYWAVSRDWPSICRLRSIDDPIEREQTAIITSLLDGLFLLGPLFSDANRTTAHYKGHDFVTRRHWTVFFSAGDRAETLSRTSALGLRRYVVVLVGTDRRRRRPDQSIRPPLSLPFVFFALVGGRPSPSPPVASRFFSTPANRTWTFCCNDCAPTCASAPSLPAPSTVIGTVQERALRLA